MYNPWVIRFPSPDPLIIHEQEYPKLSPYQLASNTPIQAIDLDGLEGVKNNSWNDGSGDLGRAISPGKTSFTKVTNYSSPPRSVVRPAPGNTYRPTTTSTAKGTANAPGQVKATTANTGNTQIQVSRATQLQTNQKRGAEFQKEVKLQKESTQNNVVEEITVKTESGVKTRLDIVGNDKGTGKIKITEAKSSQTASLTDNQKAAFPEIEKSGGTVVGKGKPPFVGGTKIPPTKIDVVRKSNIVVKPKE